MPKVLRQVMQEIEVDQLNNELAEHAEKIYQNGVFLIDAEGKPGEEIEKGDLLIPNEQMTQSGLLAPDTHVYVGAIVPEAGIFWGVYHQKDGNVAVQFFNGVGFAGKYTGTAKQAMKTPKKPQR